MGRFLVYIILIVVLLLFLSMNWSNTSSINFWFGSLGEMKGVPICLSFLFVFLLGALSVVPFVFKIIGYYKKREKERILESLQTRYEGNRNQTQVFSKKEDAVRKSK
jgi:uncharacterized integral membrane protein